MSTGVESEPPESVVSPKHAHDHEHASEPGRRAATNLEHFRTLLHEHMEKRGLRSTDQRRLIVETFFQSPNHISIEELLAQVRREDPKVGYATVYRTLKLLTECGVAFER